MTAALDAGANVNATPPTRLTPLHKAAVFGHRKCGQLLIDRGADVLAEDLSGNTPLHTARTFGHADFVKMMQRAIERRGMEQRAAENRMGGSNRGRG